MIDEILRYLQCIDEQLDFGVKRFVNRYDDCLGTTVLKWKKYIGSNATAGLTTVINKHTGSYFSDHDHYLALAQKSKNKTKTINSKGRSST